MFKDENRHYSLRKLSVGLASVLIGISFVSGNGHTVKADTVKDGSNGVQTVVQTTADDSNAVVKDRDAAAKANAKDDANTAAEANAKDDANTAIKANAESTPEEQGQTPEAVKKNSDTITQDSKQKTVKASEVAIKVQNNTVKDNSNETTLNTKGSKATTESMPKEGKTEVKENQGWTDPAKNKLQMSTVRSTTSKRLNVKLLAVSKVMSQVNDTNGGFDSSWGKLDVNDWKGSVQGDYYQLTDYTGDANHIIVPNEADFAKAGISTSGKQVGVTSDLMHTIFRDKTTAQNATVAFSKTDNKQVKAIDNDWSNTWGHGTDHINGSWIRSKGILTKFDGSNLDVANVTDMSNMFYGNQISDLSLLANWNVANVTDMNGMFDTNQVSDLSPLANWHVNNVTNMSYMFNTNQISDLSSLINWKTDNVIHMDWMFDDNQISDLRSLANWHVDNVTTMSYMFSRNRISNLSPLAKWHVNNVTNMRYMFDNNQISNLSPLANWNVNNVTNMRYMFDNNQISNLSPLANWNVNNVTDMSGMFNDNQISDLRPLANWHVDNVTTMNSMFLSNQISNLSPLANWNTGKVISMHFMFGYNFISDLSPLINWKTDKVTDMSLMFDTNQISDISPLSNWKVDKVTNMSKMFDANVTTQTKTIQAKRIINFVYPTGYTGEKQDPVTQIIDVPQKVNVILTTKDSKPSNNILDWVTKIENLEDPDPVYFQDYAVPEIKGLLEPDQTVISKQQADITKPINVTVTYKLVASNTNDAFALDSKNGLHEHINVNDNGGYDADYWGKLDINDWDYTANGNVITINGYKGENPASLIIPNGADFGFINDQNNGNARVEISSDVMRDLAENATRIGLSKTANNKVAASDAIWQDAFGGVTNELGTDSNADGGVKYGSPNLTQMDLHNLDTATITDMSALFNGGSNLTTVGDLSDWNTNNVTTMHTMFQAASSLTNIGDLSKWQTGNVTDMSDMFQNATSLTNIGDLSKWRTGNVTDMSNMFNNATNLTNIGDLSKWQTGNVTDMSHMFTNATNLTNIGNLDNWDTSKVTDMHWMFGADTGKQSHLTNIGDLSKWQTGNVIDMHAMFANATNLTNIGNLDNWDTSNVTDMSWMFGTTTNLTNIGDLSKWQTGNVTDMHDMFYNATNLTNIGNLDNWDTSKVTDMHWMFGADTGKQSHLTNIGDLSKWQTGNVTDMHAMFYNVTKLTNIGNLDNWDTGNVTDMSNMFDNATNLTNIGDLSKWQTGNVADMTSMFRDATKLTNIGNLDNWDTSKVTDMHAMFANATNLTNIGDLSKWQTGNVADMSYMFMNTDALHNLNISNWDLTELVNKNAMQYMFANDVNLTVIANDLKLPAWYQNEINDADYFWNNHMAVITNVPELIRATGDINNLKIDKQNTSRSIFYDSKGSSDAIQVLKDANQAYINKYEHDHPKYLLALDTSVDQTDPIALANAKFKTSHKIIDVIQTNHATRTIIVHLPNGTTQTIVQTIGLKRNAQQDLVTEVIRSTAPWGLDEANSSFTINGIQQTQTAYKPNSNIITFSRIKLPKVPGYKAKVIRNNGLLMVSYLEIAGN